MSSPVEKKTPATSPIIPSTPQSTQISSLPDDLMISIFALVSRMDYPILSLVSKRFRSLLTSPELYETRSLLGRTKSCLYVCLRFPSDSNPRWFTLCRKPKSNGHVMAAISIPNSPPAHWSSLVVVGSDIYNIGGSICEEYSSSVSILDCRSHTWREAPSMLVDRNRPAAIVVDGKIYVAGGCREFNSSNWVEVFDLKTQTWECVLNPIADSCETCIRKSAVIGEAIYFFGINKGVAYHPQIDRWHELRGMNRLAFGFRRVTHCAIDNLLYRYSSVHGLLCYDSKIRRPVKLKVLDGLPKFDFQDFVGLGDYGGKMAVFWEKYLPSKGYNKEIWCAVITLRRRNNEVIYGKVEWFDAVFTFPESYEFVCACAATV